jgi:hypothetical protein
LFEAEYRGCAKVFRVPAVLLPRNATVKINQLGNVHRRLHNEELNDLYSSPNIIRVIEKNEMVGHVARMGEKRGAYRILVGRPDGRRPLGRPRHRWEDSIKMDLQEVRWGIDWIELAQDRDRWRAVVAVMNLQVP